MFSLHRKVRIFDFLHSKLHIEFWKISIQLFVCFNIFYISHYDIFQIKLFIKSLKFFVFYIQNRFKVYRNYIVNTLFIISNFLFEISINYRFNKFDIKYFALIYKRHQILNISIYIKNLKKANCYALFVFALKFLISNISKMTYYII